jgi:hypothetical protein
VLGAELCGSTRIAEHNCGRHFGGWTSE